MMMLWRLLGLLAGAVSQRIDRAPNATKSSCAGHGCGRAAVALVGGFSDVTFQGCYNSARNNSKLKTGPAGGGAHLCESFSSP